MITPEQVRDLKLDDFKKTNVTDQIANVRHSFHRVNRTNKLVQLGQALKITDKQAEPETRRHEKAE